MSERPQPSVVLTLKQAPWISSTRLLWVRAILVLHNLGVMFFYGYRCYNYDFYFSALGKNTVLILQTTPLSLLAHMMICSYVGVDRLFVLTLVLQIFTQLIMNFVNLLIVIFGPFDTREFIVISSLWILVTVAKVVWNIHTKLLYLNTFRSAVEAFKIDPYKLMKRLSILLITAIIFVTMTMIITITLPNDDYYRNFPNCVGRSLVVTCWSFIQWYFYVVLEHECFPKNLVLSEKVFLTITVTIFLWLSMCSIGMMFHWSLVGFFAEGTLVVCLGFEIGATIWIWYYGCRKLEDFTFMCIDEFDSDNYISTGTPSFKSSRNTSGMFSSENILEKARGNILKLEDFEPSSESNIMKEF